MRTLTLLLLVFSTSSALAQSRPLDTVAADRIRIRAHLAEVEAELRAADVTDLTDAQRSARSDRLNELRAYRLRGEFPHGSAGQPGERVPTFIDRDGRACAMGQLVIESGHREVAEAIARDQNHARVPDITHPALGPWLQANGMTVAEATRVQPAYCWCDAGVADPVCDAEGQLFADPCTAECAGITATHPASCDEEGVCTCISDAGTGTPDAGVRAPDAGEPADLVEQGCGCRIGQRTGGGPLALALLGIAVVLRRRRRA